MSNTYKVLDNEIGRVSYKFLTSNFLCYTELDLDDHVRMNAIDGTIFHLAIACMIYSVFDHSQLYKCYKETLSVS